MVTDTSNGNGKEITIKLDNTSMTLTMYGKNESPIKVALVKIQKHRVNVKSKNNDEQGESVKGGGKPVTKTTTATTNTKK